MTSHHHPSREEVESYLHDRRNWGRWGSRGAAGAVNLIDAEKRREAARLVESGRPVSLSRPFPVTPSAENLRPAVQFLMKQERVPGSGAGFASEYYGVAYHGQATTHIDALCHVWDGEGGWDGRDADENVSFDGVQYGTIDEWSDGILTRGVLLDVPRHRGVSHVTMEQPVHGGELREIAVAQGVDVRPGDALCVYSGRERFAAVNGGSWSDGVRRPGLHASCLPILRDLDVALLVWDMMDAQPNEYGLPWTVHGAIFAYGVALVDNALLEPLADACAEEGRYEFMLTVNPLRVLGGTGSPANPIAVF